MNTNDHAFDESVRRLHARALEQVSARTHAQLQVHRQAALRTMAWPLAAACAAGVLAVGVQWRQPAPVLAETAIATSSLNDLASIYSTFDEAPDLYLWLTSSEAAILAMEQDDADSP